MSYGEEEERIGVPSLQDTFDYHRYVRPGEVTEEEVKDMKRAFDMLDEDRSGSIDVEELQNAAFSLGIAMDSNIKKLLPADEQITFDDFYNKMTAKLTPDDGVDEIMNIFELFDTDRTGTISLDNLKTMAKVIGAKEDEHTMQEMLNLLDTDGDGELDPVDFYTCIVRGMQARMEAEELRRVRSQQNQQYQSQLARQASRGQGDMRGR